MNLKSNNNTSINTHADNSAYGTISDGLKPYDKCQMYGAGALSDAELLAVIIRTGNVGMDAVELSQLILNSFRDDGLNGLYNASFNDLIRIKGIGRVKAMQIACICELSRRISKQKAHKRLDFGNPESVAAYYMEDMRYLLEERVMVAALDSQCGFICDSVISVGTIDASLISCKEVFRFALKCAASKIVLLHNHPSGNATPSRADIEVTENIYRAGQIIGIELVDHIVIGDNSYVSLKDSKYF